LALLGWVPIGACGEPPIDSGQQEGAAVQELVVARDLHPDPDIVEIELVAAVGVVQFLPGRTTTVFGYRDGSDPAAAVQVPGPLIEITAGQRLIVHFRNELPNFATTVHWHGLRLPAAMDGNPMVSGTVAPGSTFEYDFLPGDSGLHWYHPHVDTDLQMAMGLYGPLMVREAAPLDVDAERIFVLHDVQLLEDDAIATQADHEDIALGRRGNVVLVNGGPPGTMRSQRGSIERWRIVNSSNGRFLRLSLGGPPMRVIGWDGGFVRDPYEVSYLLMAPGERYDLLVTMPADADELQLRSEAVERGHEGIDRAVDLVRFELRGEPRTTPMPDIPGDIAPPLDLAAAQKRVFTLTGDLEDSAGPSFFINGERWPLSTPLRVRSGDVDVWEIINDNDGDHPFHIHGLFFEVLERGGEPVPRIGWKDTAIIPPNSSVVLAVPYDEPGMWMYHCQIPEHAERGMMGDLIVEEES
jgi:FtsP/CotA-like multicopper oxidase with cupredoxin domain